MYTIIYPSFWGRYAFILSRILKTRQGWIDQELDPFDTSSTIYVAYEKSSYGIFGSCRLNLLSDSPIQEFYQKACLSDYLEVSLISWHIDENHWLSKNTRSMLRAKRTFYQGLYHVLTDLAKSMNCKGLMSLHLDNNEDDFSIENWPSLGRFYVKDETSKRAFWVNKVPLTKEKRKNNIHQQAS